MQTGFVVLFLFFSGGLGASLEGLRGLDVNDVDMRDLITFRLFTRRHPVNGVLLPLGDKAKLIRSGFDGSLTTVILTHGFMDTANSSWILRIKTNVLREERANVITVDYSTSAKNLLYDEVVDFLKRGQKYIGRFIEFLQEEGNFKIQNAHLIGHSLGAQVLSLTAKNFPPRTLGRLTGLDPASPLFENNPQSDKIGPNDAKVVDVIHTCVFFVGIKKPAGIIDFYPNGGFNQPGCKPSDLTCHHAASRDYFADSIPRINRDKYVGSKCETLKNALNGTCNGQPATMGYRLSYSSPGMYYLKIN